MNEKMEKLMANDELMKGLVECSTPDELMKILKENELELEEGLTPEEAFKAVKEYQNDEVNDDQLENVSGGIAISTALLAVGAYVLAGGELTFLGAYAYQKVKNAKIKW
jgi:hypothetical protein